MTDPYRAFLCACIRGDRAQVRASILHASWNWELLFQTASDEAILPLLYSRFQSLDLPDLLPPEIADFLLAVESANRERNQAIKPVANRFAAAGKYGVFALHLLQVEDSLGLALPVRIKLNPFLRLCWSHRKTLQRHPKLRYFDPFYMLPMVLAHRVRKLRQVLATSNGARYMLSQILASGNYMRLWTDLAKGGR
jgi:hypothetical protein